MAWARAGTPEGSLVVAEQQISARSRPRRPWPSGGANDVSFTLVLRPELPPVRGGILHLGATAGIADVLGPASGIEWPDEVYVGEQLVGLVSVHIEQTIRGLEWALVNVMLPGLERPRPPTLARVVEAVERRCRQPAEQLIEEWSPRCRTLGRTVSGLLYPIGREQRVTGRAVGASTTGTLTIMDAAGRRQAVRPQELAAWDA